MSKICTIFHEGDLDGWMSAAIVKKWFIDKYPESKDRIYDKNNPKNYKFDLSGDKSAWLDKESYDLETDFELGKNPNKLYMLGYNYGQPIPDLSEYDKVIMCDISFPKEEMKKLHWSLRDNLIWLDHHISAINDAKEYSYSNCEGLRLTSFAACELTWKYFFPNETMPEIVRLLGRYDCFGHKGTDEEQKVLEFQYGARMIIDNYEKAYDNLIASIEYSLYNENDSLTSPEQDILIQGKSVYKYLYIEAKQIYKNGFDIHFRNDIKKGNVIENGVLRFICINKERFNPINFGINYHKDGYEGCACFHYANGMWNFSLYNDNGEVDCSQIAKQYGGGGHFSASGFMCNNETFLKIINND